MRPPGITSEMIGLHPSGLRVKRGHVHKTDLRLKLADETGAPLNHCGLAILATPITRPARERFPAGPDGDREFESHLKELGARIATGERNAASRFRGKGSGYGGVNRGTLYRDGAPVPWLDLRTLACAGCRRTLLGPSDEPIRREMEVRSRVATHKGRLARLARRTLAHLPPPVAGSVHGRPVCANCLPAPKRA